MRGQEGGGASARRCAGELTGLLTSVRLSDPRLEMDVQAMGMVVPYRWRGRAGVGLKGY